MLGVSHESWISDWISGCVSLPGIHLCKARVLGLSDSGFPAANKRCCFGGEPFLPATVSAQEEPDKAEIVNVLLQGIIQWFLSKDAVSSKFLSQRCCI